MGGNEQKSLNLAFIHPDLGIGGAERLVVDAAVGLQDQGHTVTIYTSYCNKAHAFEEVKDGTLKVVVLGDTIIPPKIFGQFAIICAILRQLHLCWQLIRMGIDYDAYVVDQLSACVPFLRLYCQGRILFYGHFPDQLLAKRPNFLKKIYRFPFDWFEKWSTQYADVVVVNSKFTRSVFRDTIRLNRMPEVIYPCVDTRTELEFDPAVGKALDGYKVLVSVNRFERTKKVDLAVESFAKVCNNHSNALLVVAGGYDPKVAENREYMDELKQICEQNSLNHATILNAAEFRIEPGTQVVFLPSVATVVKNTIIKRAEVLLYTPLNEHFGIVPLESMLLETPCVATDTGGPLETITSQTGWNLAQTVPTWSQHIDKVLSGEFDLVAMGKSGRDRVLKDFSREKMAVKFDDAIDQARHVRRQEVIYFANVVTSIKGLISVVVMTILFQYVAPFFKQS